MAGILLISLCIWGCAKAFSDLSILHDFNKWYKEYSKDYDANFKAGQIRLAEKGDYGLGGGMVDFLRYGDGSHRYVPLEAGGDGNMRAEKGKYFD